MAKCMPKDSGGDAATKQRKENNYRAKKCSKSTDTKGGHSLENLDASLPAHVVTESQIPTSDCKPPHDVQEPGTKPLPAPLDASIPFKTQFGIVTTVQSWLEQAIFEFFRKWLPKVLEAKDIDVAEKVELTDWADTIGREIKALPKAATDRIPGTSLMQELRATYQLRNAALKRQQLSSIRLLELLGAASNLVTIMKDEKKIALVGALIEEIQAGSRVLETQLEATKQAIMHDSEVIEGVKKRLSVLLVNANKVANDRCERNRKGVGITLDLFLENTRRGSTSGGQMAIFEDELLQLPESQETLLPEDFQSQYTSLFQTGSMQASGSVKLPAKDREKDDEEGGEEGGEEDNNEDGKEAVAISSSSLSHAVTGKGQAQDTSSTNGSSTGTSSALVVPVPAEDGWAKFKDSPKAINSLTKNLTSKSNSSASPVQITSNNRTFAFLASQSKSTNPKKDRFRDTLDLVSDADFTFKTDPLKSTANAASALSTDKSTDLEPTPVVTSPLESLFRSSNSSVSALSSTQPPSGGQENEQELKSKSFGPTAANTTADSNDPSPARNSSPVNPTEKDKSIKGHREQGSRGGSLNFADFTSTVQIKPATGATTSSRVEQSTIPSAASSQLPSDTTQSSTKSSIPSRSCTSLPQAPSPFSRLGTSPVKPVNAPLTKTFKIAKPVIGQITRCFGTAESLPFNPLYMSELEGQMGGGIANHMLSTQSITFMMGHRNFSFEVCHIAKQASPLFSCVVVRADTIQGVTISRL